MARKTLKILLPTIAGFLLVLICLQLRQTIIDKFYEYDAVLSFQPLFDLELYAFPYLPICIIGFLFQFFVTLRVWNIYSKTTSFLHFKLWQLLGLSCLMFGIIVGLFAWNKRNGATDLILQILLRTGLAIVYWVGNLFTLFFIDKIKLRS
jgi:hypothetical protein